MKVCVDAVYINNAILNVCVDMLRVDFYNLVGCDVVRVGVSELVILCQALIIASFLMLLK